jgi:hypothetical protein
MRSTRACMWVFGLGLLGVLVPLVLTAAQAAEPSPRAKIVAVEGATTTWQVEGMHGQTVTVEVPSQTAADVKLSDAAQGTVQGTVVALDGEMNRVKVHTREGQMVVLEMPRETIMKMRLGDTFTLAVPRPAGR